MRKIVKIWHIIILLVVYLFRLIKSNMSVAYDILTPKYHMRPGILKIPVEVTSDHQILALVNLITMTPGTLSLDLSNDKKFLYIHAMYVKDIQALHDDIKSLEKMIKRAF